MAWNHLHRRKRRHLHHDRVALERRGVDVQPGQRVWEHTQDSLIAAYGGGTP
jgi:hypothetical protein